ncbi:tRNA (cytidine(34)-2'-O)-methyltransferase [Phaeospirillum tilakii]|uniref:tRNA (cytidine(34)-2'-O)-methyltransferase n=1 Tax=Phaeospirillum tilakii TaxID=741673 RepID=A0ABW5CEN8_9PROT
MPSAIRQEICPREPLRLALFQPDIPQNAGTLIRLSACFGLGLDVIEPCGFVFDDRKLKRAGMDYIETARITRHPSWEAFARALAGDGRRLVLLTTAGEARHDRFAFAPGDTLMVGRESGGVPAEVAAAAAARLRIPMAAGVRSLNVAVAAAIGVAQALGRLDAFPDDCPREEVPA